MSAYRTAPVRVEGSRVYADRDPFPPPSYARTWAANTAYGFGAWVECQCGQVSGRAYYMKHGECVSCVCWRGGCT